MYASNEELGTRLHTGQLLSLLCQSFSYVMQLEKRIL